MVLVEGYSIHLLYVYTTEMLPNISYSLVAGCREKNLPEASSIPISNNNESGSAGSRRRAREVRRTVKGKLDFQKSEWHSVHRSKGSKERGRRPVKDVPNSGMSQDTKQVTKTKQDTCKSD